MVGFIYIYIYPPRGQYYITLVYKRYILPIGWLYTTYHSLQEPEKSSNIFPSQTVWRFLFFSPGWDDMFVPWKVDLKYWDALDSLVFVGPFGPFSSWCWEGSQRCRKANRLVIFKRFLGGCFWEPFFHIWRNFAKFDQDTFDMIFWLSIELEAFFRTNIPTSKHFMVFKVYGHPWCHLTNPPAVCCDAWISVKRC